jgi:hypothetical protein
MAEDEAMKAKFASLKVPDQSADALSRRVKVWFGMPSAEREIIYPFISIDLIDIVFGSDRAHSLERVNVDWWPSTAQTFDEYATMVDTPLNADVPYAATTRFQPYDIFYQVATHCRYAIQDRYLTSQMLSTSYAPLNNLGTLHVPADETQRWLDNVGWQRADYRDTEDKTVWRKVYTIKVSAHMPVDDPTAFNKVLQVAATINGTADGEQYDGWVTEPDL